MSKSLSASQQQVPAATQQELCPDWKRQLAERLDAYRAKRPDAASPHPSAAHPSTDSRASRIARSVASRYADAPSYSELLLAAAQAEHAAAEAQAALAQRVAEDARIAREKLEHEQRAARMAAEVEQALKDQEAEAARNQPGTPVMPQFAERSREMHLHQAPHAPEPSLEELLSSTMIEPRALLPSKLIEFPRELVSAQRPRLRAPEPPPEPQLLMPDPPQLRIFEVQPETAGATPVDVPADARMNAHIDAPIEGPETGVYLPPMQTAAAAGVPLTPHFESEEPAAIAVPARHENPSLRTHPRRGRLVGNSPGDLSSRAELSRETSSPAPRVTTAARDVHTPARPYKGLEWAAISLDKEPALARSRRQEPSAAESAPFITDPATIDRRLMAFAVDFAAVTAGFLAFLLVFAAATPHLPTGVTAFALGGAVYGSLWLLYQVLFFSFSGATAGMLYARIALCTFDDQNPTRSAMRRRLAAWWLSCLPLALGFLWCFVDEDNLSWHDRMTHIYQRSY